LDDEDDEQNDSEEDTLNVITNAFEDDTSLAINKIHHWNPSTLKKIYPKPSPPDP